MAVYAVGDVQGCYSALEQLLDAMAFDANKDSLWFTGDLVNRGPDSLAVLRLVRQLGSAAITVLGNHDLHLLAIASGASRSKRRDTLDGVLQAPDAEGLLAWLRHQPLLHHDAELGYTLVHAGLLPEWDLSLAMSLAAEVETVLRGPKVADFFLHMYGNQPNHWDPALAGWERLRLITNVFTRLRFCDGNGHMNFDFKGAPEERRDLRPWFDLPQRRNRELRILFGHWSRLAVGDHSGAFALDSGCLWGGRLSAMRLDDPARPWISIDCEPYQDPKG